jgi:hypothetical protein
MKTIKTVEQIKNLNGRIYVRWSKSIALDNSRGYSRAYGTGREAGLSACEINKDWPAWRIIRQLQEYVFCGGSCWIVSGTEIGRGSDNEPLLTDVECLGKVASLISADWLVMQRDAELDSIKVRIAAKPECAKYYTQDLAALESNDRSAWQKVLAG